MFTEEEAQILALLVGALPTPIFDGGEGGFASIQVPDRETESSNTTIAYVVYTLVRWMQEGKLGGILRAPGRAGEP